MDIQSIEHQFNKLPDALKREVSDFIDFLLTKKAQKETLDEFKFDWEGGLSNIRDKYNSVDLQHQSLEWR